MRALNAANLETQIANPDFKSRGTWMQRWRVPLGFVCGILFLVFARPTVGTLIIGGVIALPGLALRAWASGHLRKNETLAVNGPYAYTRNPLYLGSFLIGIGFTIATGQWFLVLVFLVMILGIYLPVMRVESETLAQLFGKKYQRYAKDVPLLLPRLSAYSRATMVSFDRRLYLRYREYRAALGSLIAWALLAIRMIYFK